MTNTAMNAARTGSLRTCSGNPAAPSEIGRPGLSWIPRGARLAGLAGAGALGLGMVLAAPAWAHDTLIDSTPEDGEVLDESPEEIVLEFSGDGLTVGDEITNSIWVVGEDGENWEGETEVEGSAMYTPLEEELPNGEYEIVYRVVYSDGHSEELDLSFEVDVPGATTEDAAEEGEAEDSDVGQEDSAEGDAPEGESEDADQETSEEEPVDEAETGADEGIVPGWALWGLVAAAIVVAALVAVTVRRKLKE